MHSEQLDTKGSPLLAVTISPFGEQVVKAFASEISKSEPLPAHCRVVAWGNDFESGVGSALTGILDVRHNSLANLLGEEASPPSPLVLFAGALGELSISDLDGLRAAACQCRQELARSALKGDLVLMIYDGPIEGRLPAVEARIRLDDLPGFDGVIGFSDTDARGRRFTPDDVAAVAGQVASCLYKSLELRESLRTPVADFAQTRLAAGWSRLNLSEAELCEDWRQSVRMQLHQHLFSSSAQCDEAETFPGPLTADWLASLLASSGGSVAEVHRVATPMAMAAARHLEQNELRDAAQATRDAVLSLLPPPESAPPLPMPWWWRILNFLIACWNLLFRRMPRSKPQPAKRTPSVDNTDSLRRELTQTEMIRIALRALELDLSSAITKPPANSRAPLDWGLLDLPPLRETMASQLPQIDELAWKLAEKLTLDELSKQPGDFQFVRQWIDEACDKALASSRRFISLDHYKKAAEALSRTVAPLFPGYGPIARWAFVPEEAWDLLLPEQRKITASDKSLTFLVLQRGIRFSPQNGCPKENGHG